MKCNQVRNFVVTYVDSELDAKTSQEIQLHLESCEECAQLFEHEEKFNERLFGVLRAGTLNPALWEQVESRLRPERGVAGLFQRWKLAVLGGLAAVLVAGLTLAVVNLGPGASSFDLARAVEKDHREFVQGKMAPDFAGAVPDEIAKRMSDRLDTTAFAKVPTTDRFRSEGARFCHLDGVPVAWTLGRCGEVPVSWIVFKKSELDHFPETRQRLETGELIVCARTGGFQFAVRIAGDHVVCAIAGVPRQTLEDLLKSVSGPG